MRWLQTNQLLPYTSLMTELATTGGGGRSDVLRLGPIGGHAAAAQMARAACPRPARAMSRVGSGRADMLQSRQTG